MNRPHTVPMIGKGVPSPDRHANGRDRKATKAREGKAMRGNRSVFTIQDAIIKRGREAKKAGA